MHRHGAPEHSCVFPKLFIPPTRTYCVLSKPSGAKVKPLAFGMGARAALWAVTGSAVHIFAVFLLSPTRPLPPLRLDGLVCRCQISKDCAIVDNGKAIP